MFRQRRIADFVLGAKTSSAQALTPRSARSVRQLLDHAIASFWCAPSVAQKRERHNPRFPCEPMMAGSYYYGSAMELEGDVSYSIDTQERS